MVSKLKFKGEKPKKRKRDVDENKSDKIQKIKDDIDEVWVTAKDRKELTGPIMILGTNATCISAELNGKVYVSNELDFVGDKEKLVDRVEPTSTQQVFVIMPLELGKETKYAFKIKDRYLTIEDGYLSANSTAVGDRQTFVINQYKDGWSIGINKKYITIGDEDVKTTTEETPLYIRIQAQNAIKESASYEVKQRISTKELVEMVGRKLGDNEVRTLKKAFKEGKLNEALLDFRQKSTSRY